MNYKLKNTFKEQFLSKVGYYKLSEKEKKILWSVIIISLALHVIALIVFGSYIILRADLKEETVFISPPPPLKTYQPKKLEHRVKIKRQQRSSSRPTVMPRMVSLKTASISLPAIEIKPKLITTSFLPKFKAVSGKGIGIGTGTGYGLGGFGVGVSDYKFFGIRGKTQRVAILVDVSVSMVEKKKGGVKGFRRVKAKVAQVIDNLHPGTLFNVITFGDAADRLFPHLVRANEKNKKKAKKYIKPFNEKGNWGLSFGNIDAPEKFGDLEVIGGTTRLDLALYAAFKLAVDTILIISDGAPEVWSPPSREVMAEYKEKLRKWHKKYDKILAKWEKKYGHRYANVQRIWVPNKRSSSEPPKEGQGNAPGHYITKGNLNIPPKPTPPPEPDHRVWTIKEFLAQINFFYKKFYKKKGIKHPVIHCIGYRIDRKGRKFLYSLARKYKGKFKRVARISLK